VAGFSFFTIDPGDHVVSEADALEGTALTEAFEQRPPWAALDTDPADLLRRLSGTTVDLGDRPLRFAPGELERAAVKYGGALAHVARLARHLRGQAGPERAELEVSVDETDTPTTLAEHAYLAIELRRLGVDWVSLAPRFVGAFEKGVDYIGDLGSLARDLDGHARVATALGPYKLSLHSGSDKFAVYPIAVAAAGGLVHLKTAGTSYLEALRVAGQRDPELLHAVMRLGLERFAEDVKSYHISGRPEGVPDLAALPGTAALALLEQVDARQVLHVTFGSALRRYGESLKALLRDHPDDYRAALRRHFERHLAPFVGAGKGGTA
jgi:tagaturonate epimerase